MRRLLLLFLVILAVPVSRAQFKPLQYGLFGVDSKTLAKDGEAPASNSINDILILGDTIWLGTSRGLSRSLDGGSTWTNFYGNSSFGTESISAIAWDHRTRTIWVATAHSVERTGQTLPEGSGIRVSSNGGADWLTIPQPLDRDTDTLEVYGGNLLRALPVTVAVQNIIYDIAITPNCVWVATFAGGVRKNRIDSLLANPNARWNRVVLPPDNKNAIKPTDTLNFCVSPVAGKFCSDNNLNYRGFSVLAANDSTVYVGTANGINKTTDALKAPLGGNLAWVKFNHQNQDSAMSGNFVVALDYDPVSRYLWAATWKAEDLNEFYGVSFSANGGASWGTALRDEKAHNFGVSPATARVIACTDNGPYRSNDFGGRWLLPGIITDSKTAITLQTSVFYSAAFNAVGDKLWLGTNDGLIRNTGIGAAWPSDWSITYASRKLESNSASYAFPNPFSPRNESCKITYSTGGENTSVTIRIFNFSMQLVRTVVQNALRGNPLHQVASSDAGVNGVIDVWNGTDDYGNTVPNGVYFYKIELGSGKEMYGKIVVLQ